MNNLTAARDAVGSEEPIATGGWSFLNQEFNELNEINEINELNKVRLRQLIDMLFSRWCV